MSVPVSVILERKGSAVFTIPPDAPVTAAVRTLADHRVGALVVSGDGQQVEGVVSERDVILALASAGASALGQSVREVMSADVTTCGLRTGVTELMTTMTNERIRHVPVVADGVLVGIVSIGDVVKNRLDELEVQTHAMEQYVTGSQA